MFDKSGLDNDKQLRLRREIDSMKRLKHKNIIRLYEVILLIMFFIFCVFFYLK